MWDLQAIVEQNNLAAVHAMMDGESVRTAESAIPTALPLEWLARHLKVGPPMLSEIFKGLTDIEDFQKFLELVRTFLPEHKKAIYAVARSQRVHRFCYFFGKKYYPLPAGAEDQDIKGFVFDLPVEMLGMSPDAYHELDLRPGYILLLSLVIYPYEGIEWDEDDTQQGGRVALMDAVTRIVGEDLAIRVSPDGWTPAELHHATDGTKYDGVGYFADWTCALTQTAVLDGNYGNCEIMEGETRPFFLWSKANVENLASQWPRVQEYRRKIDNIVGWLETNPPVNFKTLLDLILPRIGPAKRKALKGYYDPWEHIVPLDTMDEDSLREEEAEEHVNS